VALELRGSGIRVAVRNGVGDRGVIVPHAAGYVVNFKYACITRMICDHCAPAPRSNAGCATPPRGRRGSRDRDGNNVASEPFSTARRARRRDVSVDARRSGVALRRAPNRKRLER